MLNMFEAWFRGGPKVSRLTMALFQHRGVDLDNTM